MPAARNNCSFGEQDEGRNGGLGVGWGGILESDRSGRQTGTRCRRSNGSQVLQWRAKLDEVEPVNDLHRPNFDRLRFLCLGDQLKSLISPIVWPALKILITIRL